MQRNIRTIIAVAALLASAKLAHANPPQCKKTTTIETAPNGDTVVRTKTICTPETK